MLVSSRLTAWRPGSAARQQASRSCPKPSIKSALRANPDSRETPPSDLSTGSNASLSGGSREAAEGQRGTAYYVGLVNSDIRQDNGSSSTDMLVRNLQLAGGVTGVLGLLLLGFMASNGLLGLPGQS